MIQSIRFRLPPLDADAIVDCSHHDAFARAMKQRYSLIAFHPQDSRLTSSERTTIRKLFSRGHDRGVALEIFAMRSMLAFNPACLEALDRMTLGVGLFADPQREAGLTDESKGELPLVPSAPVTFFEVVTRDACRFITGDHEHFCGRARDGGRPYCAEHAKVVYSKARADAVVEAY